MVANLALLKKCKFWENISWLPGMLLQNSAFCNNIRTANEFEIVQVGFDSSSPQVLGGSLPWILSNIIAIQNSAGWVTIMFELILNSEYCRPNLIAICARIIIVISKTFEERNCSWRIWGITSGSFNCYRRMVFMF